MKKIYVKPGMRPFELASTNIMGGSVKMRSHFGLSAFHTDEDDWETEEDTSTGKTTRKYNFWN